MGQWGCLPQICVTLVFSTISSVWRDFLCLNVSVTTLRGRLVPHVFLCPIVERFYVCPVIGSIQGVISAVRPFVNALCVDFEAWFCVFPSGFVLMIVWALLVTLALGAWPDSYPQRVAMMDAFRLQFASPEYPVESTEVVQNVCALANWGFHWLANLNDGA